LQGGNKRKGSFTWEPGVREKEDQGGGHTTTVLDVLPGG